MSNAPWRNQISLDNQNKRSTSEFRNSYPEFTGLGKIVRGEIVTLIEVPRKRFYFLVNPSDIQSQYGISEALDFTNPNFMLGADASLISDGLNSISFSVLLDRTYEVYQGDAQYRGGVLHDVLALEQVVGVPSQYRQGLTRVESRDAGGAVRPGLSEGARSSWSEEAAIAGLVTKKQLRVLFGGTAAFSFDGFINNLSIHYTHFTRHMVPTRAGVTISMVSRGTKSQAGPDRSSDARVNTPAFGERLVD